MDDPAQCECAATPGDGGCREDYGMQLRSENYRIVAALEYLGTHGIGGLQNDRHRNTDE